MIETILIATDGSEAAASAEKLAIALAARTRARLRGLTVVDEGVLQSLRVHGLGVAPPSVDGLEAFLKARADAICRRLAERARAGGVEVACDAAHGAPDDCIVERGRSVDCIVLGRDGEHAALRTALVGPVTDAVLRKTAKPTLVVPSGAELSGPVLLAFDGSPGSRLAAAFAVELATRLGEAVHVFVDSKDKGRAAARFEEVRQLLGSLAEPRFETSSTLGRPDVKIIDAARAAGAGLIVMGAFGRNRINEYFLGSNAAAVVRASPIAVFLAR